MNRCSARMLVEDVAHVAQGDIDAGSAEHEASDQPDRPAAGDDDFVICHLTPPVGWVERLRDPTLWPQRGCWVSREERLTQPTRNHPSSSGLPAFCRSAR